MEKNLDSSDKEKENLIRILIILLTIINKEDF
jgi:hypothetical protein